MESEASTADADKADVAIEKMFKKKSDRERKKGDKKMDQFMKSISGFSPTEKIDALVKRNSDVYEEKRELKENINGLQRKITVLEREKTQLQNEQSKAVLARSRLETLCRELQRLNKTIKDENTQKIREEEEKRKEMSTRFQAALNEVTQMMQKNNDKNSQLREDNIEITTKFQKICNQFKLREEEVVRLTKQMDLEKQLAEATLKRFQCELIHEKEMWNAEKVQMLTELQKSEEECIKLKAKVKNLEDHVTMYSTRYEDFENTITKSNKVFDSYKTEMSRLTKQVSKLEGESQSWQGRCLHTQLSLNKSFKESQALQSEISERDKKLETLTNLCRQIQEERSAYLLQLKDANIIPVKINPIPPPPAPPAEPKKKYKITSKEKELFKLKKEVQKLSLQLNEAETQETFKFQTIPPPPPNDENQHDADVPVENKDAVVADVDALNNIDTKPDEMDNKIIKKAVKITKHVMRRQNSDSDRKEEETAVETKSRGVKKTKQQKKKESLVDEDNVVSVDKKRSSKKAKHVVFKADTVLEESQDVTNESNVVSPKMEEPEETPVNNDDTGLKENEELVEIAPIVVECTEKVTIQDEAPLEDTGLMNQEEVIIDSTGSPKSGVRIRFVDNKLSVIPIYINSDESNNIAPIIVGCTKKEETAKLIKKVITKQGAKIIQDREGEVDTTETTEVVVHSTVELDTSNGKDEDVTHDSSVFLTMENSSISEVPNLEPVDPFELPNLEHCLPHFSNVAADESQPNACSAEPVDKPKTKGKNSRKKNKK